MAASDGEFEDKIRVTWHPSPEAETYEIFRADSFAGQKTKIETTTAATVYEDRSLACGVDFYYWVKAVSAFGESDLFYSDLGFVRCPAPVVPGTQHQHLVDGNESDDAGRRSC